MYLYIFQIAVLLWGGKKKKYIFLKLNYPTFINLSHYPRLSPHLAHRCQITAQANSWSPSPKDFQLLWSTHYAQFSSSDSYIHPRGGGGGSVGNTQIHMTWNIIKKMRFNSYSGTFTEYSSYNFLNKFEEWSTNALIQHLVGSEGILPLVWEDFLFLNRVSIDQIKSLLCKSNAGHYEPPSHDAISFPLFPLTKLFLLRRVV